MIGIRYRLPAIDDRGTFDVLVPDGAPELTYTDAELAARTSGYDLTPERWDARQVKVVEVEVAP